MDGSFGPRERILWPVSVFTGIVMCKIVYDITRFISLRYFRGYHRLSESQKVEWNNRGFSTFYALLVAAVSFYLLVISDLFKDGNRDGGLITEQKSIVSDGIFGISDPDAHLASLSNDTENSSFLRHRSQVIIALPISEVLLSLNTISVGYFLADLGMILWLFPSLGGMEYVLHHGLSMYSILLSLISGKSQFYVLIVLFSEITTPFVNLRWYLDLSGQKNSNIYLYNSVSLFLGWLATGVLLYIYYFLHIFLHFDQVKRIFPLGFYSTLTVPAILAVLNLFWLWKLFKGMMKTLSKKKHTH